MKLNTRFMRLVAGANEVWSEDCTWDDVVAVLDGAPTAWLLAVLGWISRMLNPVRSANEAVQQASILRSLFADEADQIWRAAANASRKHDPEGQNRGFVLFTEDGILNLLKTALIVGEPNTSSTIGDGRQLGRALLCLNTLTSTDIGASRRRAPASEKDWILYLLANSLFHFRGHELHDYARTSLFYLRTPPPIIPEGSFLDLPERFKTITGLAPDAYWALHFALTGHFSNQSAPPLGRQRLEQYLDAISTEIEREALREWSIASAPDLTLQIRDNYSLEDLKPYHVLPLARKPFIEVDGYVHCPSVALARNKMTSGVYHAFLDPSRTTRRERDRFLSYNGQVFETYVESALGRMFPPLSRRFITERELRAAAGERGKICDGAVLYPRAIILIEVKASRFSLAARTGMNWTECADRIEDIFVDAAEQLVSTARMLWDGRFASLGIDKSSYPRVYPVIVTAEDVVMNEALGEYIDKRLDERIGEWPRRSNPLQVVNIGEVELVEVAISEGASLLDWLDHKASSSATKYMPLLNYLHAINHPAVRSGHNAQLDEEFQRLSAEAVAFLENRTKSAEPPPGEEEDGLPKGS